MKYIATAKAFLATDHRREIRKVRRFLRWVLGGVLIVSGASHFFFTGFDEYVQPSVARWPQTLIYLGGAFEMMLGGVLFLSRTQVIAAWAVIALLIAVTPAYVYTALNADSDLGLWERWERVPLLLFLIGWAFWYTRPQRRKRISPEGAQLPDRTDAAKAAPAVPAAGDVHVGMEAAAEANAETGSAGADAGVGADEAGAGGEKKAEIGKGRKKAEPGKIPARRGSQS